MSLKGFTEEGWQAFIDAIAGKTAGIIGGYGPNHVVDLEALEDEALEQEMIRLSTNMLGRCASMDRLLRKDKPIGEVPSLFSAKPKGRGLTPRHELWAD